MFAIRLRVRPCRARCSPRSVGRVDRQRPSSIDLHLAVTLWLELALRALDADRAGLHVDVDAVGISIGFLPIRLMCHSPDVGDDLAADALRAGLVAGHHAGEVETIVVPMPPSTRGTSSWARSGAGPGGRRAPCR
jgi:hypothetical protein